MKEYWRFKNTETDEYLDYPCEKFTPGSACIYAHDYWDCTEPKYIKYVGKICEEKG